MSINDVLGRIQQLQALVNPQSTVAATAPAAAETTSTGQDFGSTLAAATSTAATPAATALPAALSSSALMYGSALPTAPTAATAAVPTALPTPATSGNDVVADSINYLGVPYKWGGTDPSSGLDCSGLVQRVYADKGVALPRTSAEQATTGTEVPGGLANAQPGDLVFFGSPVHHVGIYAGNNMMVEAPHTGTQVQVHSIDSTPTHVRRIALTAPVTATTIPAAIGTVGTLLPAANSTAALSAMAAVDPTAAMDSLGVPAGLRAIFTTAAQSQGLPVSLLAAVAKVESGFNATSVSSAGAQGIMQLMPDTAAGLGANPWDPASAANGAAKLLRGYLDKYGSVPLALAAYNAGPGAVAKYGGVPPYAETQAYVQRVGALAAAA